MPTILWWWSGRIWPLSALLCPAESLSLRGLWASEVWERTKQNSRLRPGGELQICETAGINKLKRLAVIWWPIVFVFLQTPFTLTLRLWDIFILEGERLLTAMSYTILKIHKSEQTMNSSAHLEKSLSTQSISLGTTNTPFSPVFKSISASYWTTEMKWFWWVSSAVLLSAKSLQPQVIHILNHFYT